MTRREIERFFTALSRRWTDPLDVILIGGSAAVLAGSLRPTKDVEFEARLGGTAQPEDADMIAAAVDRAIDASGVKAQFSVNIAGWSDVALPPYRDSARRWKRFGRLTVRLLEPSLYAVSKLRRGAAKDFTDLILVGRAARLSWTRVARTCGNAVRLSPPSTQLRPFVNRVEYLFKERGRELWGPRFDPEPALALFRRRSRRSV
jgi:hypothetical protein